MPLYGAMDLQSNNTYVVVLDDQDQCLLNKRLPNRLEVILRELEPYRGELLGVAVESTFNWDWLVDGLMDNGYCAKLVNTCAVQQNNRLKFTDDRHDARWLAHLLRPGILPPGYIYPKERRPIRDLLRQRASFVHHRTAHLLSLQNQIVRQTGQMVKGNALKRLTPEEVYKMLVDEHRALGANAHLEVIEILNDQIHHLEQAILAHANLQPHFRDRHTVNENPGNAASFLAHQLYNRDLEQRALRIDLALDQPPANVWHFGGGARVPPLLDIAQGPQSFQIFILGK